MKKMILMRGLPGSGKSTLARKLQKLEGGRSSLLASTDDFFEDKDGVYRYRPALAGEAHKWNQHRVWAAMQDDDRALDNDPATLIIIDNTNLAHWEMRPYVELAVQHGYEIEFATPPTAWAWDVEQCVRRTMHDVPLEIVQRMTDSYQPSCDVGAILASLAPWEEPRDASEPPDTP